MYLNHHGGRFQIEKNYFPTLIHFRSFYSHFFKVSVWGEFISLKYNFGCLGFFVFVFVFLYKGSKMLRR